MNTTAAEAIIERVLAYWPANISDEEAKGWVDVLTSPQLDITYTEAATVLRKASYAGDVHRPRPGQVVAAVSAERRAQARRADTARMLESGRSGGVSPERTQQWIKALRRVLDGESLEDAKMAEGVIV